MREPRGRITAATEVIYPRYDPKLLIGREWLMDHVRALHDGNGRGLLILGTPGTGKSTFAAYLAESWNCPRHFVRADNIGGVTGLDRRAFLISIGAQLYQKYGAPIFTEAISPSSRTRVTAHLTANQSEVIGRVIEELYRLPFLEARGRDIEVQSGIATGRSTVVGERVKRVVDISLGLDDVTLLHAAMLDPLGRLAEREPQERVVLVVDALDEGVNTASSSILGILPRTSDAAYPSNLLIIATSRPDLQLGALGDMERIDLDDPGSSHHREQQIDVERYIDARLSEPATKSVIAAWDAKRRRAFRDRVFEASDGNFLYVFHYMNAVVAASDGELTTTTVPKDLDEIYRFFVVDKIKRQATLTDWAATYLPLLATLAVAREPITRDVLAALSGVDGARVNFVVAQIRQFLRESDPPESRVRFYHRSLGEYLLDSRRNRDFPIDASVAHYRVGIAYSAGGSTNWQAANDYALAHSAWHLGEATRFARSQTANAIAVKARGELLRDFQFLETKVARFGVEALLVDFDSAPADARGLARFLRVEAHHLAAWDPQTDPAMLAQQLLNGAIEAGDETAEDAARRRLRELGRPYVELKWRVGNRSEALQSILGEAAGPIAAVSVGPDGRPVTGAWNGTITVWGATGPFRSFEAHRDPVRTVSLTRDGRVVSGSEDGTIKVWDVDEDSAARLTIDARSKVNAVVVTEDGRRIVSGSDDGAIRIWELDTGAEVQAVSGESAAVLSLAVSAGMIVSGHQDGTVRVWDLDGGLEPLMVGRHGREVAAVALTSGVAASGAFGGSIKLWDISSGREIQSLAGHSGSVFALASASRGRIVSGSADGLLKVWDVATGNLLASHVAHISEITAVAMMPDGSHAVSGGYPDRRLRLWDLDATSTKTRTSPHMRPLTAVACADDGERVASASADGTIVIWDVSKGTATRTIQGEESAVRALAITPDDTVLAVDDASIREWDPETGEGDRGDLPDGKWHAFEFSDRGSSLHLYPLGSHQSTFVDRFEARPVELQVVEGGPPYPVRISRDGRRAALGVKKSMRLGRICVRDEAGDAILRTVDAHDGNVSALVMLDDRRQVVSASLEDPYIRVWDIDTGDMVEHVRGHYSGVGALATSGTRLLSGARDGSVALWNTTTWAPETVGPPTLYYVPALAFVSGKRAVSIGRRHLDVWDLSTLSRSRMLIDPDSYVIALAANPNDKHFVTASRDAVRMWNTDTGEYRTLNRASDDSSYTSLVVAPNLEWVAAGSSKGAITFWDYTSGSVTGSIRAHDRSIGSLAVTPDGRRLVSGAHLEFSVWDVGSGRQIRDRRHEGNVTAIAVAPDGRIVTGSDQFVELGLLQVADLENGTTRLSMLVDRKSPLTSLALTADDRWAVFAAATGPVRVADIDSGALIATCAGHSKGVTKLAVTQSGRIVAGASDGSITVWEASSGARVASVAMVDDIVDFDISEDLQTIIVGGSDDSVACLSLVEPVDAVK